MLGIRNYVYTAEAFAARDLGVSKMTLATRSTHIRANLVSMGGYIATFPHSILRAYADRFSLKALSIRPSGAPMASYRRDSEESNFESDRCTSSCMFEISRVR